MKNPKSLTKAELVTIVEGIRDWLWLSEDTERDIRRMHGAKFAKQLRKERQDGRKFLEYYNPDKEWDADITQGIADMMEELAPEKICSITEGYPDVRDAREKKSRKEKAR